MVNNWKFCKIGDVAGVQGGYAFKSKDFSHIGIPVIKIKNVRKRDVDLSDVDRVSKEVANKASNLFVKNWDVLISMTGSGPNSPASIVGRVARHSGKDNLFLINQRVGRFFIKDKDRIDQKFLYYLFSQDSTQLELLSIATGSANQANISGTQIESLEFNLPPLVEQKAIAHILSSLDEKIELNRQINETLEAMAQALFKSWFVDFDPVIDNALAAGNIIPDEFIERAEQRKSIQQSKDKQDICTLFPNKFELTEKMGWIPSGWETRNLTEIADFQNGFAFYTTGYSDSGYKVVDLANISTDGRFIETSRDKYVSSDIYRLPKHEKHHLHINDIVMAMTDITQAMGILGKCGKIYESNKYILNQRVGRIRVIDDTNVNFLLTYLNSSYQLNFLKTRVLGTVQKYVNTTDIKEMDFIIPKSKVMNEFSRIVDPQFNKMRTADEENETLSKLRDTLLPKLMSGELRISNAAALVDEAI